MVRQSRKSETKKRLEKHPTGLLSIVATHKEALLFLILWLVLALFFSYQRSFWCDELIRFGQIRNGLFEALRMLFSEPSPFSPGEVVLNWVAKLLFSSFAPAEIWARLPGIGWGLATMALAVSFDKKEPFLFPKKLNYPFPVFSLLVFASVSLFTLAIEMRPYGSLYFAGALSFCLLFEKKITPLRNLTIWFSLVFSHLYGICFVAFACLLRKRWTQAFFGFSYVSWILYQYREIKNTWSSSWTLNFSFLRGLAGEVFGSLGNPHKMSFFFIPMFLIGMFFVLKTQSKTKTYKDIFENPITKLSVYFGMTVLAPICASLGSGYFFTPRQIVGGAFGFLAITAYGLRIVLPQRMNRYALVGLLLIPWILSVVFSKPPFPNQPLHRFKQVAQKIFDEKLGRVLLLDPCNEGSMVYYLSKAFNNGPINAQLTSETSRKQFRIGTLTVIEHCWDSQDFCLFVTHDQNFCSPSGEFLAHHPSIDLLLRTEKPFDLIVYSSSDLPAPHSWPATARTW